MRHQINISESLFLILASSLATRAIASNILRFAPYILAIAPNNFYPSKSPKKRALLFCVHVFRSVLRNLLYGANGVISLSPRSRYYTIAADIINTSFDEIRDILEYVEEE